MPRKRYSTEQIITKLRQAEVELSRGLRTPQVCKKLGVSEQTYYRWRTWPCLADQKCIHIRAVESVSGDGRLGMTQVLIRDIPGSSGMTPGCDSREDNNLSSDAEVPTRPAKTLPLSRSRSVKRDIVGTHQTFVFYSLVDVRDGFARDCPHRHPVLPMLALRDRSRLALDFLVGFRRFQRLRARCRGAESRLGQGGGRWPRDRLASQVRWSGVLREPCTTDPCQSSGPRSVGFRDGSLPPPTSWCA